MHKRIKAGVGIAAVMTVAASLGSITSANADAQPHANDIVGVGSDTVQYVGDFLADGDNLGDAGYNSVEKTRRIFNFDATTSANGNTLYGAGGVAATGSTVPGITAVFRAGSSPIWRVNGSGDGIAELIRDTTPPYNFQYIRSSRAPKSSEITSLVSAYPIGTALTNPGGTSPGVTTVAGVEVYKIATDGMNLAVNISALNNGSVVGLSASDPLSCAPALSTAELTAIYNGTYKKWGDIPGYSNPAGSNCSTEGIVPDIPQTGSGTYNDFYSSIGSPTLAANVVFSEEHDPGAIAAFTAKIDANGNPVGKQDVIEPFSTGRYNLIQTGYFDHTLDVKGGTSYVEKNTISLVTSGTAPDGGAFYNFARTFYILVRQADLQTTTPFLPGGSLNWVNTLFGTPTSYYAKASNASLFTAAGVTQAWKDCGANWSGTPAC